MVACMANRHETVVAKQNVDLLIGERIGDFGLLDEDVVLDDWRTQKILL